MRTQGLVDQGNWPFLWPVSPNPSPRPDRAKIPQGGPLGSDPRGLTLGGMAAKPYPIKREGADTPAARPPQAGATAGGPAAVEDHARNRLT